MTPSGFSENVGPDREAGTQKPGPGKKLAAGSKIKLTVSIGRKKT